MAGQVGKLILETGIKGFEEVQELGKGLKQIAKLADRTDKEFLKAAKSVKDFANQNRNSVTAIRGQIVALDKLKQSATIGGKAYKALSKDIISLNTQLLTLSNTEKIAQQSAAASALVDRDAAGRRMDDGRVNRGQLLSTQDLFSKRPFVKRGDIFDQRVNSFAESMKSLNVGTDKYRELLGRLIETTRVFNNAQAASSNIVRNKNAMSQVRGEIDQRKAATLSRYSITRESPSPMSMQGPWDVGQYKREFQNKGYWEKFFKTSLNAIGITSPDLQRALDDVVIPPAVPAAKRISQAAGDPFTKDPYKNILPTTASYRTEIAKLDDQLDNLTHNSEEYNTVARQKAKLEKELAAATKETIKAEKQGFRTDRRTRGRGQVYRDPSTGNMIGRGQSFALPSGVESGAMQTVQSLKDFVVEQEKLNVTGKSNINTLTKTRSKFEEIRNTLDPTSKQFKQVTKAIAATDKALLRLSNNKFSGQNLRRTGQSILGAGFVGGPAGFLGAGVGAGIEALRPGGDMAGGAITGGLVASQVLTPVSQAIGGSTEYASQIEKADIALKGITKTTENYEVAQAAITKAVEVYNVPQEVAMRGMTRLSAAVLGAGGNIHNAAEAFLNTTVAIKGTAGSADDVKSAITAMVQIFSKGKVSAEELSGQLGERFPAAVTKFAKANNISTQELQKNLKDGTVGLDMLSKFITSLGEEYAPLAKRIAESNEEAGARSRIAMNKMKIAVGTSLKEVGAQFQIIGAELLVELVPALKLIGEISATVFSGLAAVLKPIAAQLTRIMEAVVLLAGGAGFVALGKSIAFLVSGAALPLLTTVIGKLRVAIRALRLEMMLNPLFAAGVGVTAVGLKIHKDKVAIEEFTKDLKDGVVSLKDAEKTLTKMDEVLEGGFGSKYDAQIVQFEKVFGPIGDEAKLKTIRDRIAEIVNDLKDLQDGTKHIFDPQTGTGGGESNSPFAKFTEELEKFDLALEQVAVNGFKKLEDTIMKFVTTGKLAFKDLVTSVLHDLTRLAIQETVTKPLFGIFKKALGIGLQAAAPSTSGIGPVADLATYASDITSFTGGLGAMNDIEAGRRNAMGNAFAKNGIVPYYKGGVVSKPTMFKYGGSQLGIMGEAGPEAILPLQRGRGGRLGVAMQGGGGATTVNYTGPTLNFNGDEYVPRSAVGSIVQAAATRGAALGETSTMRSLQNNRSARGRLGM